MNSGTLHPALLDALEALARERRALEDEILRLRTEEPPPSNDDDVG